MRERNKERDKQNILRRGNNELPPDVKIGRKKKRDTLAKKRKRRLKKEKERKKRKGKREKGKEKRRGRKSCCGMKMIMSQSYDVKIKEKKKRILRLTAFSTFISVACAQLYKSMLRSSGCWDE